jgi:hypothetical protein
MRSAKLLLWTALLLGLAATPTAAVAQSSEAAVKAAFLPRFARYVAWPPQSRPRGSEAISLCLVGGDPFGKLIDRAAQGQSVDGRRLIVRRLTDPSSAGNCDIAYVQGTRTMPVGQMLTAMSGRPVLTVTDAANSGQRGIIHFAIVSGRVRFFIDQASARQKGLTVSSRLLALAVGVRP